MRLPTRHDGSMKAYSEDLRRKIVEALARGTNKCQAAQLPGMSFSSLKRYAKMVREGQPLAPKNRSSLVIAMLTRERI